MYTRRHGLEIQIDVGRDEGLKHDSSVHCDELVSLPKHRLTDFVGTLSGEKLTALRRALRIALDVE